MFRLLRTVIFVGIAFVAGVLYERFNVSIICGGHGAEMIDGVCMGAKK